MRDIGDRWYLLHSPAPIGDRYAGVALVISREYSIEATLVAKEGRVMAARLKGSVYSDEVEVVVVAPG